MGKLIVIEGACDGIGKSTQYEILKKRLKDDGYNIVCHHFPSYGEYQGALVEKYLKGEYGNIRDLSPYFVNNLYALDRAITWNISLKKEYDDNIILLDRYTTSSLIYQSALIDDVEEKKKFIDYVIDFEYEKLGIKEPDLVIFLSAPFDIIENLRNMRKSNDGIVNDIHEKDREFMKKVYDNALFVSKYLNFSVVNCCKNNCMRSIEDISNDVYSAVKNNVKH